MSCQNSGIVGRVVCRLHELFYLRTPLGHRWLRGGWEPYYDMSCVPKDRRVFPPLMHVREKSPQLLYLKSSTDDEGFGLAHNDPLAV